jgi:hypothetical protein
MFEPRDREAQLEWRVENWRRLNGEALRFDAEEFRALERRIIAHAGRHDTSDAHARADPSGLARGAELAHVTVPTLVIATPEDPTNPESNSRFLAEPLPQEERVQELECGGNFEVLGSQLLLLQRQGALKLDPGLLILAAALKQEAQVVEKHCAFYRSVLPSRRTTLFHGQRTLQAANNAALPSLTGQSPLLK